MYLTESGVGFMSIKYEKIFRMADVNKLKYNIITQNFENLPAKNKLKICFWNILCHFKFIFKVVAYTKGLIYKNFQFKNSKKTYC